VDVRGAYLSNRTISRRRNAAMSHPQHAANAGFVEPPPPARELERRHTPAAARGPYLTAIREAWQHARAAYDAAPPALVVAVAAFAHDGRARGVPVETLLRALDTAICRAPAGERGLDHGRVREWAGTQLIRSYYCAD
jgi:hypothetical protein